MLKKCRGKLANTYFKIHLCGKGFPRPKDKTILFEEVAWRYGPQSCVWNRPFKSCVSQQYFWKRLSRTYSHRRVFERSCSKPTVIRMALEGAVAMPIYPESLSRTKTKRHWRLIHIRISPFFCKHPFKQLQNKHTMVYFHCIRHLFSPTWQAGGQ